MRTSPENKKTSDIAPQGTAERILRESALLFGSRGFAAVSMREIAQAVGITAAALYNHYKSKEEIRARAYEVFITSLPDYDAWIGEIRADASIPDTRLADILFRFISRMQSGLNETLGALFRFLLIEHFSEPGAARIYREWLIERPARFFKLIFDLRLADRISDEVKRTELANTFNRSLLCASIEVLDSAHPGTDGNIRYAPVIETVHALCALFDP
jgi:AcrR family transcriptional regulator